MNNKLFIIGLVLAFSVLGQNPLYACDVCFSAKGATLAAFRWSALFLSLVPFASAGIFILWYKSKLKKQDNS